MRPLLPFFLAAALAACGPPPREPAMRATDGPLDGVRLSLPHDRFTLPNGLEVIVAPDSSAPDVAVRVRYHVGSRDDAEGREGTAHFVEHLTFVSVKGLPEDAVIPTLHQSGATEVNGLTSPDSTDYVARVAPEALERVLWIERQRMHAALDAVTPAAFERERGVVRDEERLRATPWYALLPRLAGQVVFPPSHPYARTMAADGASLARIELERDARAFYRRHYGPNHATLVLAGRLDRATGRALAERWFGDLPPAPPRAAEDFAEVRSSGPRRLERAEPVRRPTVLVAWPLPPASTVEADAANAAFAGIDQGIVNAVGSPAHHITGSHWAGELGGVAAVWLEAEDDGSLTRLADRTEQALDAAVVPDHHARAHRTRAIASLLARVDHLPSRAEILADGRGAGDPAAAQLDRLLAVGDAEVDAALRDRTRRRDRRVVVLVRPSGPVPR